MKNHRQHYGNYARRGGFSMAETVICVMIVGGLFIAALNTAGAAAAGRRQMLNSANGMLLAQDMMGEILQWPYKDSDAMGVLGPEDGEAIDGTRQRFDDIDDYNGWDSPPQDPSGAPITWAAPYRIVVSVNPVNAANLAQIETTDTGIKRVRVEVFRGGIVVATLTAYRTQSCGQQASSMVN